ncbi:MAG TPA: ribonuclease H-like domain-containing protein [Polyangiales bacterium]|nr:ribonuclease H-like domain-containing protein [Polyangiales bacterium]
MNLRDKLQRLQIAAPAPDADPAAEALARVRALGVRDAFANGEWERAFAPAELAKLFEQPKLERVNGLRDRLATLKMRPVPAVGSEAELEALKRERRQERREPAVVRRAFAEALLDVHDRVPAPPTLVPGERIETAQGPLYATNVLHGADHRHGGVEVVRGAQVLASEVALLALDEGLAGIDYTRALYIDTETTGLVGGSGTLPFLIGMAWFEGEQLMVEQLLLPRPGHEAPMLARLKERLAQASVVVSFNGKSFDWPLLRTRYVMNRMSVPVLPPHLDLLHCSRRVYKLRLGSVRLIHLEQEILNYERIDDLPGELIPQRYFEFLRGNAEGGTLIPILDHNRSDLVALPALLGELVRRLEPGARQHVCDQLAFARVAARGQERERAIAHAQAAIDNDVRNEWSAHAHLLVGELELRRGEVLKAIAAYEAAVELGEELERARAHLALAKLHEHKTKRFEHALAHAACTAACEGAEAQNRRVARLTGRIERRAKLNA